MPDAGPAVGTTTIGVSDGASILFLGPTDTGTWAGQTVTGSSTLAMYTYAGDVNFDGLVDASDYGIIDNYFQFPGTTGYANGDFNYDGVIDAGDYGIIDNTFPAPRRADPNRRGSCRRVSDRTVRRDRGAGAGVNQRPRDRRGCPAGRPPPPSQCGCREVILYASIVALSL
jgi:hypothetical protein